jgi:hypothetical protein
MLTLSASYHLSSLLISSVAPPGFGYRAGYIVASVAFLNGQAGGGEAWLEHLRSMTGDGSNALVREGQ